MFAERFVPSVSPYVVVLFLFFINSWKHASNDRLMAHIRSNTIDQNLVNIDELNDDELSVYSQGINPDSLNSSFMSINSNIRPTEEEDVDESMKRKNLKLL